MDNNKPPQYQQGIPNYFSQFSTLNQPQKTFHDHYGKQFPPGIQNLNFIQNNKPLDANTLKSEKNDFDEFVDMQNQQQNNFYNFNEFKDIQQHQYQLPPAQIQPQDFSMFNPYQQTPYIDIFDQYMVDQGPKKEVHEQFIQNNFDEVARNPLVSNQQLPYLVPNGHPKQEETEFKFNYNPQTQFAQNHFNAISDMNNNLGHNLGRQATAMLDDLIIQNYKQPPPSFYNNAPPTNLDQISQFHMLLQNPALLQGIQKFQKVVPNIQPIAPPNTVPQQQFYNSAMIPQQPFYQQPYFMNNQQQKNFCMQPPHPQYPSQVPNNFQPLMQVQSLYPQQSSVQQFQQPLTISQPAPYNYQFQTQQMIKKEDRNEDRTQSSSYIKEFKGQNLLSQMNKNLMQNFGSCETDQQLLPNSVQSSINSQNNLKYLIADVINGPFSAQNIKKTDIFISKFLDFGNLKKIKDGLTKDLIQYFSSMNLEDLLNFQSKNLLLQRNNPTIKKIGSLTYRERLQKIAKYKQKRRNRQWDKKINYDCRKQVADKRERIKGRFVTKNQESLLQEYKRQMQKIEHYQKGKQPEQQEAKKQPNEISLSLQEKNDKVHAIVIEQKDEHILSS